MQDTGEENFLEEQEEDKEDQEEGQENAQSDSDSSSENEELEADASESVTPSGPQRTDAPWRKGKLSTAQYGLRKLERFYSSDIKEIMKQSEGKIVRILDELIHTALEGSINKDQTDPQTGEKLLRALFLIKRIGQTFYISLKRPNVTSLLGKTFEYLLVLDKNYIHAAKILRVLKDIHFDSLDLSAVEAVMATPEALDILYNKVFENWTTKDTDLRIGREIRNITNISMIQVLTKISQIFKAHFKLVYDLAKNKRLDFQTREGLVFRSIFFSYKNLDKQELDALVNEFMSLLRTDSMISSKSSVSFFASAIKSKYFKPTEEVVTRVLEDLNDLIVDISKEPKQKQKSYIAHLGSLLSKLIFNKNNAPEDRARVLKGLAGYFDTIVDVYHPKSNLSARKVYYQILVYDFLGHYIRESKKVKSKDPELYKEVTTALNPLLRKVLNFSLFDKFNTSLERRVMALAYLDPEFFLDFVLQRIRFSFDFYEFRKLDVIKILEATTEIVTTNEKYTEHLLWIVPKLMTELDNSSDSTTVQLITSAINSILENFVGLKGVEGSEHLKKLVDDIDQTAIRLFEYHIKKAQDFQIFRSTLQVLFSLGDYTSKKFKEKIFELISQSFEKVSDANTKELLVRVYQSYPQETEAELIKWINKRVITKTDSEPVNKLILGPVLQRLGINTLDFKVGSTNENILSKYMIILSSLGSISTLLSPTFFQMIISILALTFENSQETVNKAAAKAIACLYEGLIPKTTVLHSNLKFNQFAKKSHATEALIWQIPEKVNPDKAKDLVGILFESFGIAESIMTTSLGGQTNPQQGERPVEDLFRTTLAETHSQGQLSGAQQENVRSLTSVVRLISAILNKTWVEMAHLRSNKIKGLYEGLKARLTDYVIRSETFFNVKLREAYLNLYLAKANMANDIIQGDPMSRKLQQTFRSFTAYFDVIDMTSKVSWAEYHLLDYLSVYGYYNGQDLFNIDGVALPQALNGYEVPNWQPESLYFFGPNLEKYIIHDYVKEFLELGVLFASQFDKSSLKTSAGLLSTWAIFAESDLQKSLFNTLTRVLSVEQNNSEKYSKTIGYIETILELTLRNIPITKEETIVTALSLADDIAKKGQFSKVQSAFFKISDYLLLWTALPKTNSWIGSLNAEIDAFTKKKDEEVTLLDLIHFTTRAMVTFEQWTVENRARVMGLVIKGLSSNDINKRIVYMSVSLFMNRLLRQTDFKEERLTIDYRPFLDSNGLANLDTVQRAYQAIKKRIGYSNEGGEGLTPEQQAEVNKVDATHYPTNVAFQYLGLPFETLRITKVEDTTEKFKSLYSNREEYENSLVEFLKLVIMESSDTVNEENLTVRYKYVELMVDTKKKAATFGRESLIFASLKVAAIFLGLEGMKNVFQKLSEQVTDQNSDYKKVTLILLCSTLSASNRYSDIEFISILGLAKDVLKPFMNVLNSKHLQTFILYLGTSLKSSFTFQRLNIFFNAIIELMKMDIPENQGYYLNVLVFQVSSSQLLVPDYLLDLLVKALPTYEIEDLNNVNSITKMYLSVNFIRHIVAFNEKFAATGLPQLTETDLTRSTNGRYKILLDNNLIEFLDKIKTKKILTRFTAMKTLIAILGIKRIDIQNIEIIKHIFSLIFTLDPNEDMGMTQTIQAYHKVIDHLKSMTSASPAVKDELLRFLLENFEKHHSVECLKSLLKIVALGVGTSVTPNLENLMLKIAKDARVPLRDSIDGVLRKDIFERMSNPVVFDYAKKIFKQIDAVVAEKSKIKERTDERFKQLSKELEISAAILIGVVASRQWQLDADLEQCLRYIVKAKRNSQEASKRFSNFITHFWSKRAVHQDFNEYELADDLKEELNDFNNPYSYHA